MAGKLAGAIAVFASALVIGTSAELAMSAAPKMPVAPKISDAGLDASADAAIDPNAGTISTLVITDAAAPEIIDASGLPPLLLADEKPDLAQPDAGAFALTSSAPRQVRFGVILVQYAGCQGASAKARPKSDALDLANQLGEAAKKDFHDAVKKGDSGSSDDAGRIPRGVLEPPVEMALFSLPVGGVSDVLDTPRGYWIVRRSE